MTTRYIPTSLPAAPRGDIQPALTRNNQRDGAGYVAPTGAHDMYNAGEWAIFSERYYRCKQDTSYSPEEYAKVWEVGE